MSNFPALPGFYKLLFLYLEPVSTVIPGLMICLFPGASWFHHQLIPDSSPSPTGALDPRTNLAVLQLGNCYMLLGLISSIVFRAVRDALRNDPVKQERILGASLTALAIADLTHVLSTFIGLPPELQFQVSAWNATTHGNITITMFLFVVRCAWFLGIGRQRYYYGATHLKVQ